MMNRSLSIELLRTFVTVVETEGFTQAGARLHRSQAAISIQVRRLEELLDRRLFVRRQGRLIGLTESGEVLLSYAREMLRVNDEAVFAVSTSGLEGSVRLGTPEDFASNYLPLVLARFAEAHPRVRLEVRCDLSLNLLTALRHGQLDIALVRRDPQIGSEGGLYQEPLVWVRSRMFSPSSADPLPLALFPEGCSYRSHAIGALEAQGRSWRATYVSPSLTGIQAAVLGGLGVSALPQSALLPGLQALDQEDGFPPLPEIELAIEISPQGLSEVGASLIEYIEERVDAGVGEHAQNPLTASLPG